MISINTTQKRSNLTDIISYIGEWAPSKTKVVFYSHRSLSHSCLRLGTDSLVPLMNVLKRKKGGFWVAKTGRNLMIGERENARVRMLWAAFYTTTLCLIDRLASFILSHLLLFLRGETAENSILFSPFSLTLVWDWAPTVSMLKRVLKPQIPGPEGIPVLSLPNSKPPS